MRSLLPFLVLLATGCSVATPPTARYPGDLGVLDFVDDLGGDRDQPILLGASFELRTEPSEIGALFTDPSGGLRVVTSETCDGRGPVQGPTRDDMLELLEGEEEPLVTQKAECETVVLLEAHEAGEGTIAFYDDGGGLVDELTFRILAADDLALGSHDVASLVPVRSADGGSVAVLADAATNLAVELLAGEEVLRHNGAITATLEGDDPEPGGTAAGRTTLPIVAPTDAPTSVLRVVPPDGNPTFAITIESVLRADVDDVRIRVAQITEFNQTRCFSLEAYARRATGVVLGAPMTWSAGPAVEIAATQGPTNIACLPLGGTDHVDVALDWDGGPWHQRYLDAHPGADPEPDAPAGEDEPDIPERGCSVAGGGGALAGLLLLVGRRRRPLNAKAPSQ